MTQGQVSQLAVKVLSEGTLQAQVSQIAAKVLTGSENRGQLSQLVVKVLADYVDLVTTPVTSTLQLEDNPYIQSYAQADRLVRMVYDFYHTNHAIITLDGVGYDPDRYLGEVVEVTNSSWGMTAKQHRIIGLDYTNGATMTVKLAPLDDLPTSNDVFIVYHEYVNADERMVSY